MEGIVVYASKYGSTKQYGEWIAEELRFDCKSTESVEQKELENYNKIIIGTPLYFGQFRISKWINKNLDSLKGKDIYFFVVNCVSKDEDVLKQLEKMGLNIDNNNFFVLKGQVNLQKLRWFDKFVTNAISKSQKIETNDISRDNIAQIVGKIKR